MNHGKNEVDERQMHHFQMRNMGDQRTRIQTEPDDYIKQVEILARMYPNEGQLQMHMMRMKGILPPEGRCC